MGDNDQQGTISQASLDDTGIQSKIQSFVDQEGFRKHIIAIIKEYTESTIFVDKVKKCVEDDLSTAYSSKHFEEFQTKVQEITKKVLADTVAQKELDGYVQGKIDTTLTNRGLKSRNFWLMFWVAGAGVLVAIASAVIAVIALNKP